MNLFTCGDLLISNLPVVTGKKKITCPASEITIRVRPTRLTSTPQQLQYTRHTARSHRSSHPTAQTTPQRALIAPATHSTTVQEIQQSPFGVLVCTAAAINRKRMIKGSHCTQPAVNTAHVRVAKVASSTNAMSKSSRVQRYFLDRGTVRSRCNWHPLLGRVHRGIA